SSGGPLWLQTKSGPTIYGVTSNSTGRSYNEFTRITNDRFKDIGRWIREDNAQRPLYTAASRDNSSRDNITAASTRVAVGQFEDDILTGGAMASGHSLINDSSTKTASQLIHSMAQTMRSTIEADYLRHTIAPSHVGNSEPLWSSNHPFALAVQTQLVSPVHS
ncbi:hypothetical protein IFO70_39160, partial [Phormidium tenue FACHB-886]|nr:hypothetical protein [Phormidium tenue FACHB-886]